ncbi:hypothetical protein NP284_37725 [Rhodopseudomonas pseudopalustris]
MQAALPFWGAAASFVEARQTPNLDRLVSIAKRGARRYAGDNKGD